MKRSSQAITLVLIGSPLILAGCRQSSPYTDKNQPGSGGGGAFVGGYGGGYRPAPGAAVRGTGGGVSAPSSPRGGFGGFGRSSGGSGGFGG